MRIQHVAQAVKGWPGATAKDRLEGARLADIVDQHIRWRLWHGQVQRSRNLTGDILEPLDAMAKGEAPTAVPTAKVAGVLRSLETYVSGRSDLIIDYATARRSDEPISTATTESTVQWLLRRRMGSNKQMRWSSRGAHRHLHACSGCFRLERVPGGACTRWRSAALSRRTWKADVWFGAKIKKPKHEKS
jgi:hypothetical protein